MVNVIIIDKTGELKVCKMNNENEMNEELYKKCKFKKPDNFEKRHTWNSKKDKYSFKSVSVFARDTGKATTENKYDFPPPVDNILYFGCVALVASDESGIVDLSVEEWEKFYVPSELKTKSGYLKDDFVVDDNLVENCSGTNSGDEGTWDDTSCELEYEEYSYSDED